MRRARVGEAMKMEEYAPVVRPMKRARPKSSSAVAPRTQAPITRIDRIGRMATRDVLIERASTWFTDRLTTSL